MEKEKLLKALMENFGRFLKPAATPTSEVKLGEPKKPEAKKPGEKKPSGEKPKQPQEAKPADTKAAESQVIRDTFIEAGAKAGRPLTTGEKMSALLSKDLQGAAEIENPALVGCISRLSSAQLKWDEPSKETWELANGILRTSFAQPLSVPERIVFDGIRQAVGEYYYRFKPDFEKMRISLEGDVRHRLFDGVTERIQEDEYIIEARKRLGLAATSGLPENTTAWAQDIEKQILEEGKSSPEVHLTVSFEDATKKLEETARDDGIVKPGEYVANPVVAQVLYETVTASADAQQVKEFWLVKGNQLKYVERADMTQDELNELKRYRDRFKAKALEMYKQDPESLAKRGLTLANIEHELTGTESGMPRRASRSTFTTKDFMWDGTVDKLSSSDPIDKKYIELLATFNARIARLDVGAYDRDLIDIYKKLFDKFGDQVPSKLKHWVEKVTDYFNKLNNENSKRFSTMFFEWEDQENVFANPDLYLQNLKDEYDRKALLWPNSFQDASKQSMMRMQQFLDDRKFREEMKQYYKNPKNWDKINQYNGYQIDATHPYTEHPLYKKVINESEWRKYYKELVENFSMADIFQQIEVSFRSSDMDKVANSLAAISEHGEFVLRKGRHGYNDVAFRTLDRKGFFRGAFDADGNLRFLNGLGLQQVKDAAYKELISPGVKLKYEKILKDAFGEDYDYEEAARRAIEEMSSLHALKLRRIRWGQRGLRIHLGQEQNDVYGTQFTSVGPEEAGRQAFEPVAEMLSKWKSLDDVSMWQIEEQTQMDSTRIGSGDTYKRFIDAAYNIKDKEIRDAAVLKLKKFIFGIVQRDGLEGSLEHEKYTGAVKRNLGYFFKRDHETGELLAVAPKSLEEVTKEQLLRAATFRMTLETTTDREMLGSYDIISVSWIRKTKLNIYDKKYHTLKSEHYREVALHERACHEVSELFDYDKEGHEKLDDQTDPLVHIDESHPQKEGILITMDKCSPVYAVDALKAGGYLEADNMFDDNIRSFNIYSEDVKGKWNVFADHFLMHEEMINAEYALHPELEAPNIDAFRLNYAKFDPQSPTFGYSPEELDVMKHVYKQLYPEASNTTVLRYIKNHLNAGNIMTKWLLEPKQLDVQKQPVIAAYYLVVHQDDARDLTLDDENMAFSRSISRDDRPYNKGSGKVRDFADLMKVQKMIVSDLIPMLRVQEGKEEAWEQHRTRLFYTSEMTGGHFTNVKGLLYSTATFNKLTQIDLSREMIGQKGENPLFASSIHQRLVNLGGLARTTAQVAEQMHKASVAAGGRIEQYFPHLAHEVELQARIIFGRIKWWKPIRNLAEFISSKTGNENIGKFFNKTILDISEIRWPKTFRTFGMFVYKKTGWAGLAQFFNKRLTLKTAWVPRGWAFGLLVVTGLVIGGASSFKKGLSQGSSGGGGGSSHEES